jgi:hypothetical protein
MARRDNAMDSAPVGHCFIENGFYRVFDAVSVNRPEGAYAAREVSHV